MSFQLHSGFCQPIHPPIYARPISSGIHLHFGDMVDSSSLFDIISRVRPHEVYNLAAQVCRLQEIRAITPVCIVILVLRCSVAKEMQMDLRCVLCRATSRSHLKCLYTPPTLRQLVFCACWTPFGLLASHKGRECERKLTLSELSVCFDAHSRRSNVRCPNSAEPLATGPFVACLYKSEHLVSIRHRALFKPHASVADDLGVTDALVTVLRACTWDRFQASSSEMFGSSDWDLQNEDTPFKPCSPYGMPMFLRTGR